jgi:hypothetical protein
MLTKEEYSKACEEMQKIWQNEMKRLECTAVQAFINADEDSIEYGKKSAEKFKIIKDTVDLCISVISTRYTNWSDDAKTNEKADNKTK